MTLTLDKCLKVFNVKDQVEVLGEVPNAPFDTEFNVQPYEINESIKDIEQLLKTCEDIYWNKVQLSEEIIWNEFSLFWRVVQKIKHKREIGREVSDIEYVYEHIKDDPRVKKIMSSEIPGFTSNNIEVIYGESKGIEIYLYQEEGAWEFVLSIVYDNKGITHWHPQNCNQCLIDIKGLLQEFYLIKFKHFFKYKYKILRPTIREKEKGKLRAYDFYDRYEIIKF